MDDVREVLRRLRESEATATPGRWYSERRFDSAAVKSEARHLDKNGRQGKNRVVAGRYYHEGVADADMKFIAMNRNALLPLLDALEAALNPDHRVAPELISSDDLEQAIRAALAPLMED